MTTIIHTPTNKLENSISFYQQLKFEVLSEADPVVVTDGKAIVEINPDRYARAGVKCFKESWAEEVATLEKLTKVTPIDGGYVFSDPSGVWIYLMEQEWEIATVGVTMEDPCFGIPGNFMGLSLETTDMDASAAIWQTLGFEKGMGSVEQGWVTYADAGGFGISLMKPLMCPHLFFNPSFTYFNGKENNPIIIDKIRALGIPIAEEITHFNKEGIVDNIIIRDPGGYGFFIFND